jgi:hypothetical protein
MVSLGYNTSILPPLSNKKKKKKKNSHFPLNIKKKDIEQNLDLWDHKGIRISSKLNQAKALPRSDPRRTLAEAVRYCPAARYHHRYNRLRTVLKRTHPDLEITILPIIAGVTGTAVHKSVKGISTSLDLPKQTTQQIMSALTNAAIHNIPKILRGWRLQKSLLQHGPPANDHN